jgi:hypothetical protein
MILLPLILGLDPEYTNGAGNYLKYYIYLVHRLLVNLHAVDGESRSFKSTVQVKNNGNEAVKCD